MLLEITMKYNNANSKEQHRKQPDTTGQLNHSPAEASPILRGANMTKTLQKHSGGRLFIHQSQSF
jgi:hypothetical protein